MSVAIARRPGWPGLDQAGIINPGSDGRSPDYPDISSYCWPPTGCLIKTGVKPYRVSTLFIQLWLASLYLWLIFVSDIPPNDPSLFPVSPPVARSRWTESIHQGVDNCHEVDLGLPHNFHGHHTLHYSTSTLTTLYWILFFFQLWSQNENCKVKSVREQSVTYEAVTPYKVLKIM